MLQFIKDTTVIPFMKIKGLVEILCLCLVIASIVSMCVKGMNWGLDFTGGIVVETHYSHSIDLNQVRQAYAAEGIEGTVQNFGSTQDVMIRVAPKDDLNQQIVTQKIRAAALALDPESTITRSEYVGPAVGEELVQSGIVAIVVSLIAILIYIAFRFEWRMATGAVISLAYDVLVVLGVFSFWQIEYDLTVLAAVLTVLGYSLNDKIVVFDRIRENVSKLPRDFTMDHLFDVSLTQTLARTIITSGTTMITVLALLFFGGDMIFGFSLALTVGIVFGTISSIYVASTWALLLKIQRQHLIPKKIEKKEIEIGRVPVRVHPPGKPAVPQRLLKGKAFRRRRIKPHLTDRFAAELPGQTPDKFRIAFRLIPQRPAALVNIDRGRKSAGSGRFETGLP